MPDTINGIPTHILLVHAVIVLLPLAALALVASALWPTMRRKLGVLTPLLALVALGFVPLATNAGEWLRDHVPNTDLIRKHTELGDTLLPWAIGIFVLSAAVWWIGRRYGMEWSPTTTGDDAGRADGPDESGGTLGTSGGGTAVATRAATRTSVPTWVTAVVAAVSIVVAGGGVYTLYRIGDSGSKAVWTNNFSKTDVGGQSGG